MHFQDDVRYMGSTHPETESFHSGSFICGQMVGNTYNGSVETKSLSTNSALMLQCIQENRFFSLTLLFHNIFCVTFLPNQRWINNQHNQNSAGFNLFLHFYMRPDKSALILYSPTTSGMRDIRFLTLNSGDIFRSNKTSLSVNNTTPPRTARLLLLSHLHPSSSV